MSPPREGAVSVVVDEDDDDDAGGGDGDGTRALPPLSAGDAAAPPAAAADDAPQCRFAALRRQLRGEPPEAVGGLIPEHEDTITTIDLRGTDATEDEALRVFADARIGGTVRIVAIEGAAAGGRAVAALIAMLHDRVPPLRAVSIRNATAPSDAIATLVIAAADGVHSTCVEALNIEGWDASAHPDALVALTTTGCGIRNLRLDNCEIRDDGIRVLSPLFMRDALRAVSFRQNSISDPGARVLLSALRRRRAPLHIAVRGNDISTVLLSELAERHEALALNHGRSADRGRSRLRGNSAGPVRRKMPLSATAPVAGAVRTRPSSAALPPLPRQAFAP